MARPVVAHGERGFEARAGVEQKVLPHTKSLSFSVYPEPTVSSERELYTALDDRRRALPNPPSPRRCKRPGGRALGRTFSRKPNESTQHSRAQPRREGLREKRRDFVCVTSRDV